MRAAILLIFAAPVSAQAPQRITAPLPHTGILAITTIAGTDRPPLRLEWPTATVRRSSSERIIVGAVLGAVAGLITCTAISNISEDEGGFHTCTAKGNVLFGVGGAALGALVAHLTRR